MTPRKVLIVGGGIAGLTLAAALTRHRIPWTLLERARALAPVGTGIALMPPALRVAERLGILEELLSASTDLPATRRFRSDGRMIADIAYPDLWDGRHSRAIHRADLQNVLLSAATGGEILLNSAAVGVMSQANAAVVELPDRHLQGALVVGADGWRSAVRQSIGGVDARPIGQRVYRAFVPVPGLVSGHVVFVHRVAVLGAVGLLKGTYLFLMENTAVGTAGPVTDRRARVLNLLNHITAPLGRRLLECWPEDEDIHEDVTWEVAVQDGIWRRDRIVLIGDAAHAMSPVLAVGGAMGMEDAWVLAEELVVKPDYETALDAYLARRRPRVQAIQHRSAEWAQRARTGQAQTDPVADFKAAYHPLLAEP
jgi:salicylate hydroxylase